MMTVTNIARHHTKDPMMMAIHKMVIMKQMNRNRVILMMKVRLMVKVVQAPKVFQRKNGEKNS